MGIIFAIMTLGINSLASVIISLDQDNLMFIKSLPISFKNYIKLSTILLLRSNLSHSF